jgi:putative membrane protein
MRNHWKTQMMRIMALSSATALCFTLLPAAATEEIGSGVTASCDEAYYATLDYYGNLTEGSVVKTYTMNGTDSITDYGTYDDVINLTDETEASVAGNQTTFQFGDNAPEHFCFEGTTQQPFNDLPWTLSLSYTLNGVPVEAEDLAGKTGVVEININAVPNENASEYAKNNYTLEAMALFNQNDILSLEAEGAQVQLVGNLRLVLFLAMPGEEQHFTIRVGTDDFKFDGMTFLMVPATLSQLSQIADLSQRKDDLVDDYNKLSDSLDTMLDAMNGMSGSLNATAAGLDELNAARGTISAGKGAVYDDLDVTLGDLNALAADLEPAQAHLETASKALTEINGDVNTLHSKALELKPELKNMQSTLESLEEDLDDLNDYSHGSINDVRGDLNSLGSSLSNLRTTLSAMNKSVSDMASQLNTMNASDTEISVNGMTADQIRSKVSEVQGYHDDYVNSLDDASSATDDGFRDYLVQQNRLGIAKQIATASVSGFTGMDSSQQATVIGSIMSSQSDTIDNYYTANNCDDTVNSAVALWKQIADGSLDAQLSQVDAVNSLLANNHLNIGQLKVLMQSLVPSTQSLTSQLSSLCSALGTNGLSGSLSAMLEKASNSTTDLKSLSSSVSNISKTASETLDSLDKLNTTVNSYIPEAQKALTDITLRLTRSRTNSTS